MLNAVQWENTAADCSYRLCLSSWNSYSLKQRSSTRVDVQPKVYQNMRGVHH